MKIYCSICNKPITNEIETTTEVIMYAWIECSECLKEQLGNTNKKRIIYNENQKRLC